MKYESIEALRIETARLKILMVHENGYAELYENVNFRDYEVRKVLESMRDYRSESLMAYAMGVAEKLPLVSDKHRKRVLQVLNGSPIWDGIRKNILSVPALARSNLELDLSL